MGLFSNIFSKKAEANSSVDFNVSLSCGKCVKRVEDLMGADKAVAMATVDLASKIVSLQYDNTMTDDKKLQEALEGLGFEVSKK